MFSRIITEPDAVTKRFWFRLRVGGLSQLRVKISAMDEMENGSSKASSQTCLNCGSDLDGAFCRNCGQSASVERYTLKSLGTEIYQKFRSLDATSTFNTFKALTLRGGTFVQEYLDGKRVGFTNPIVYFFYFFVIEALLIRGLRIVTANPTLGAQGASGFDLQIVALASTVFWGFLWWVFFRRSELNLVENAVAAVYYVAQVNIVSLVFLIISAIFAKRFPWVEFATTAAEILVYFGYGIYFGRTLLKDPLWKLIPKHLLLSIIYFVILFVFLAFDAVATFVLQRFGT